MLWLVGLVAVPLLLVFLRYYRYRFIPHITFGFVEDMASAVPEGYTDRYFYYPDDTITFYLRSDVDCTLTIRRMSAPFEFQDVVEYNVGRCDQATPENASENGCQWNPSVSVPIDDRFEAGYYQALVWSNTSDKTFEIYFLVGTQRAASVVIVAPVSTWTAYNPWGGKSLYRNAVEKKTVYFVSSERPNTAFRSNHNIQAEANIFNWFREQYPDATVVPDYLLEADPAAFDNCKLLVLAYHNEYISPGMHRTVRNVMQDGTSVISLGANQLFWVVRWNENYTRMECHKDLTFFRGSLLYGGMWKHHFRSPARYLGAHFSGAGMFTFAPYRLEVDSGHWLLAGLDARRGDLFGARGIDGRPICGVETDKAGKRKKKNEEIIAHGMNAQNAEGGRLYDANDKLWNGAGGGDLLIRYLSDSHAMLNTSSIFSGAGLGVDAVFTGIIHNFIRRYGPKAGTAQAHPAFTHESPEQSPEHI